MGPNFQIICADLWVIIYQYLSNGGILTSSTQSQFPWQKLGQVPTFQTFTHTIRHASYTVWNHPHSIGKGEVSIKQLLLQSGYSLEQILKWMLFRPLRFLSPSCPGSIQHILKICITSPPVTPSKLPYSESIPWVTIGPYISWTI